MNRNEDKFEITKKNLLVGVLTLSFILGLKKMKTNQKRRNKLHKLSRKSKNYHLKMSK